VENRGPVELLLDRLRLEPIAATRALHDRAARRRFAAHEQRDADDAFLADDGDLGRYAPFSMT